MWNLNWQVEGGGIDGEVSWGPLRGLGNLYVL